MTQNATDGKLVAPGWEDTVLSSLYEVAFAAPDREVAGVLVGVLGTGGRPPQIHAVVPTTESMQPGQAPQFSHQTWAYIHEMMARYYEGLEIVGWYLSRPGMGTEPLEVDLVNHQRWFDAPKYVLLTLDSRSYRGALYQTQSAGVVQLHEGPVARRYTRAPSKGHVGLTVLVLAVLGIAIGALLFLVTQVVNTL